MAALTNQIELYHILYYPTSNIMLPNITAQPGVVLHWRTTHSSFVAMSQYIATSIIVVYIPQLTTPDPRSIAKSLRIRDYKVSLDLAITQWIWDQ